MCGMLLGYSFEPRPNSRVLATAGSVMPIGLSINGCSHSKKKKNSWQERTRLTSLRRPQRLDVIQAELPFLLLTQEDKRKLCSQGELGFTCFWRRSRKIFLFGYFSLCQPRFGTSFTVYHLKLSVSTIRLGSSPWTWKSSDQRASKTRRSEASALPTGRSGGRTRNWVTRCFMRRVCDEMFSIEIN